MRLPFAALLLAAAPAVALADPVLDSVDATVARGSRLALTVEAHFSAPGAIVVEGDVNGHAVAIRRKARAGAKSARISVDPRRFGLRSGVTASLHFSLRVSAREDAGAEAGQDVSADVPVPCVVLPGFGNEQTPGGFAPFAAALDAAAGGRYGIGSARPALVVHEYASLTKPLAALGRELGKDVKSALRGTVFSKVDLVGYSYGGVVARSYLAQGGAVRVRNCLFLGTPNEGTPIAYVGVYLLDSGKLQPLLDQNQQLADAVGSLLTTRTENAVRNVYPTYTWAFMPALFPPGATVPIPTSLLTQYLGDPSTPLTGLNALPPPTDVAFHAWYYTSTPPGAFGTVDTVTVDYSVLTGGTQLDPAQYANGSGDGVVPAHSVTMDEYPAWSAAISADAHDLGAGTHVAMPDDPAVIAGVAAVVAQ